MKGQAGIYEVVWPLGRRAVRSGYDAQRLQTLAGKTVCELWNYLYGGERYFPIIEELLKKQYPDINFVNYTPFGNTHGKDETEVVKALPGRLAEHGCDAVISGTGG